MRVWACLAGAGAGILLFATQALAQGAWPGGPGSTSPLVPGQLFVGFGAQVGTYNLPTFDSPWRSSSATAFIGPSTDELRPSIDPDPTVAGPGAVVGYVFPTGALPAWMGTKVRLSFGAQFWDGNFTSQQNRPAPTTNGYISVAPIDGSLGTSETFAGWTERRTSFNVDVNGYQLSLRLTSDFQVAKRVTLSPFLSVFGGRSSESYTERADITSPTSSIELYSLDERVSTSRIGLALGTGVTVQVIRQVSLHLGMQAGLVWLRSSMTGGDCFKRPTPLPSPGTACGVPRGVIGSFQTSVTDKRSTVGFRGGLTGGVTVDMRFAILSLTGFMTYDSAVPGIANPVVTSSITTNGYNTLPTSGRAHLFFDDALNYGGMIVLRFPLNAPRG